MDYSQLGNKRRKRLSNPHTTRVRNKIGLMILRVTLAVILVAGFAAVGAVMGLYLGILNASPDLDIRGLGPISPRAIDPGFIDLSAGEIPEGLTSFIICYRTGEELERLHNAHNHQFAPIGDMPQHLLYAFVAIEDERFFQHNGVDPRGIIRAIYVTTVPDRPTEGASTITQQLIKNMLRITDNTFINKLQEQHLAINFERHLVEEFRLLGYEDPHFETKNFILQSYLNIIYLGQQNVGVQAAAWFYYGLCVSELSIAQAATIAAITQNPSRFPPDIRPENNWRRTRHVLDSMLRLGFITDDEHAYARRQRPILCEETGEHLPDLDPVTGEQLYDRYGEPRMRYLGYVYDTIFRTEGGGTRPVMSDFDCFTDALIDQVRDDLMRVYNLNADQANHRIFNTGLRIYSTQNTEFQEIVDRAFLNDALWPDSAAGFSISVEVFLTVYNSITQERRHYHDESSEPNLAAAEAFVENMKERLLSSNCTIVDERVFMLPQPQGSFVLMDHNTGHVLSLRGIRGEKQANRAFNRATQATRHPGSQMKPLVPFGPLFQLGLMQPSTVIDDVPFTLHNPHGPDWTPANWWGGTFEGLSTARRAIYRSQNVVSARAAADISITHAGVPAMIRFLQELGISTTHPNDGAAIVLGGMTNGVKLIELTGAFATVANLGEHNRPVFYTMVLDHEGNILLDNRPEPRRVLSSTASYLLTSTMMDTMGRAGSTGGQANWTVASGLRGQIPIAGKTGTSQRNRDLGFTGYTPYFTAGIWMGNDNEQPMHRSVTSHHLVIWRTIMEEIHMGMAPIRFERPPGIVTAAVCRDSGHLPSALCRIDPRGDRVRTEVFQMGLVPTQTCRVHQQFTFCTESGQLASHNCPPHTVVTRVGIVRPQSIDHITNPVSDRVHEFPIGVRQGISCMVHMFGVFHDWQTPIWDMETGQWLTPTIPGFGDPNAVDTVDIPNLDTDFELLPPVTGPVLPVAPPILPVQTPPPWGGLGPPPAPPPEGQTEDPFVNTVTIPGLN